MGLSIQADVSALYNSSNSIWGNSKISAGSEAKTSTTSQSDDSEATAVSSQGDTLTISSAGSKLATSSASSDDSSSSSEDNLSQYTDLQLKQMLQNGEITQAEYDAEIESRDEDGTVSLVSED